MPEGYFSRKMCAIYFLTVGALGIVVVLLFEDVFGYFASAVGSASTSAFLMGRAALWSVAVDRFWGASMANQMFGFGAGSADHLAVEASRGRLQNMHSDLVKHVIDYGWVGSALIFSSFGYMLGGTRFGAALLLYIALVWLTDNTAIYLFFMVLVAFLVRTGIRNSASERGYEGKPDKQLVSADTTIFALPEGRGG